VIVAEVDVGSDTGCAPLETVAAKTVDLVICNAGTLKNDTLDTLDFDDIRHQFEVNSLGPLRTVRSLRQKLQIGSKVVLIGSLMGSIERNKTGSRVRPCRLACCCTTCAVRSAHGRQRRRQSCVRAMAVPACQSAH
jgi:NAD(P)-dependent dehydrogenase (short-subunit alcohol dehydrogenase family)